MVVLIDPPIWPAHGTVWSHLVSDASLRELHLFAERLGVPRRGFDLDHYDIPLHRYDRAVELGAVPVDAKSLVRALQGAGLRVRQVERPTVEPRARSEYLWGEWSRFGVMLGVRGDDALWRQTGADVLQRWNEPHRSYHNERHLEDVLLACNQLLLGGEVVDSTTLGAAWFHDVVYSGSSGSDEHASALFAHHRLGEFGVDLSIRDSIASCILATAPPGFSVTRDPAGVTDWGAVPPGGVVLQDADLAIFAAPAKRYAEYAASVREEYAHVPDLQFAAARGSILQGYLARPRLFQSDSAFALWEDRARANVRAELNGFRVTSEFSTHCAGG